MHLVTTKLYLVGRNEESTMSYETAIGVQRLKELGRKQGFLTYAQVNEHLPHSLVDPDKIVAVVEQLERYGIRIVENAPASKD